MKADTSASSHRTKLSRFLLAYRMAPHATTEQTPASMLLGHPVRTRLALVTSDVRQTVDDRTLVNATQRFREFRDGESVWVRNYRSTIPWIKGWILERSGPLSYTVAIAGNVIWKRHVSQIRAAEEDDDTASEENHTSASKGNTRPLTHESREQHTEQQTAQQQPPRPRAEEEAEIGTPVRNRTNSPKRQEQGERATPPEEDIEGETDDASANTGRASISDDGTSRTGFFGCSRSATTSTGEATAQVAF